MKMDTTFDLTVYHFINNAEHMAEEIYDSLYRSKGIAKTIQFNFRMDYSVYNVDGNDEGTAFYWQVIYYGRGGRYIKVLWNEIVYYPEYKESDWKEIADHDSCWRGCWDNILKKARTIFTPFNDKDGSWFFNLERVEDDDKNEIIEKFR
jgi:hypothetical protein